MHITRTPGPHPRCRAHDRAAIAVRTVQLAVVATLALLLSACGQDNEQAPAAVVRPAKTVAVSSAPAGLRRSYPARVLSAQTAELSFRVSGRLVELPVRAAMQVRQGNVIAQLDRRDFESAVAALESQLEQATAQLAAMIAGARSEDRASLEAAVRAAEARVTAQRKQVARLRTLVERGSIARAEIDQARATLAADEATLEVARQDLAKGERGERAEDVEAQEAVIRGLRAQVQQARDDLEDTTLRAPFDGVIASRGVENFANVSANGTIATLQKLDTVDLSFDVPAADVATLAALTDTSTTARLDSAPDRAYDAELVEFSTEADPTTQTFRGRVSIASPGDTTVLPGMTGSVDIEATLTGAPRLRVPAAALVAEPNGSAYVWVVSTPGNTVSKRAVEPGELGGADVEIVEGLADGDVVVAAGASRLREGMQIRRMAPAAQ